MAVSFSSNLDGYRRHWLLALPASIVVTPGVDRDGRSPSTSPLARRPISAIIRRLTAS